MSAHVALALLALGTPAARSGAGRIDGDFPDDRGSGEARQAEPRPTRDVTTAIAALAAQFRETSLER